MVKNLSIGQVKGRGRPSSITPKKSAIFLAAIEKGFTLKESLIQAEITDDSYRRLLAKSADFRGQIEVAEMKLVMLSRSQLAKAITAGDMPTIRWFLERKRPEEFRPQFGEKDVPPGLPPNSVMILPGSKPHPRIIPESEQALVES